QFSMNLARASIIGQRAILDSLGRRAGRLPAAKLDPMHIAPAMLDVFLRSAARPDTLLKAQADLMAGAMSFWRSSLEAFWGGSAAPKDKRFAAEPWNHPLFDAVRRAYLVNAEWVNRLAGEVEASDPLTKRRIAFFTR